MVVGRKLKVTADSLVLFDHIPLTRTNRRGDKAWQ